MKTKEIPIADVLKIEGNIIWVLCPYCKQIHNHGLGGEKPNLRQRDFGSRLSHCMKAGTHGEYIIKKTKLSTKLRNLFKNKF